MLLCLSIFDEYWRIRYKIAREYKKKKKLQLAIGFYKTYSTLRTMVTLIKNIWKAFNYKMFLHRILKIDLQRERVQFSWSLVITSHAHLSPVYLKLIKDNA